MIGIYIFKNIKKHKCYVGQSSNLERRKREHYSRSIYKDEFHINLRENPDDFEYKVLQECLVEELDDLELMWMNWYKNEGWELYNKDIYKHYNNRGIPCSEKTKKKISESLKGKTRSEEYRKKISESQKGKKNSMYGKHHSEKTKKKMSESHTGKTRSEETKKKISESKKRKPYRKGKKISEETKKKLSDIYKGKHWRINPETGKREWY